jgi:hypothetical protein
MESSWFYGNIAQTLLILLGALLTLVGYVIKERRRICAIAKIVVLEIKDIESKIDEVNKKLEETHNFNSLYTSPSIEISDVWHKSKGDLIKKKTMTIEDIEQINKLYTTAKEIEKERVRIENLILKQVEERGLEYQRICVQEMNHTEKLSAKDADTILKEKNDYFRNILLLDIIYYPKITKDYFLILLNNRVALTDGMAYSKLRKIAKMGD